MHMRIRYALPMLAVASALLLTGCVDNSGGGSGGSGSSAANPYGVTKDDALAKTLPAAIAKAGTITVGVDATYAPN